MNDRSKLTPVQTMVLHVIEENPGSQDDDMKLIAVVWKAEGWSNSLSLEENLRYAINPGSITRARRKLHEYGFITYSKGAKRRREENYIKYRDENSTHDFSKRL